MPEPLRIDAWSDVVCPWCAIGRLRLRQALEAEGVQAHVVHRAFELDPRHGPSLATAQVLQQRYGPGADVAGMMRRVREVAAADGLRLDPEGALSANTFDAHRLLLWAQGHGAAEALMDRLVEEHFVRHADLGQPDVLARAAAGAGLDAAEAHAALDSGAGAHEVRADEAEAHAIGVRGVPFFVLGGRYAVSGAQPVEVFRQAVRAAALPTPAAQAGEPPGQGQS